MAVGATAERPVVFSVALLDRKIIDARDTQAHQAKVVKFPVLVAIAAEPIPAVIVPFIGKADGDPIRVEGPHCFNQPVVQFADPFSRQKCFNRLASLQEFGTVSPPAIGGICERDARWVTRVPGILGQTRLFGGGFVGERWQRRAVHGGSPRPSDKKMTPPPQVEGQGDACAIRNTTAVASTGWPLSMPVDRRIAGRFVNARQERWTESLYRLFRAGMGCGNGWVSLSRAPAPAGVTRRLASMACVDRTARLDSAQRQRERHGRKRDQHEHPKRIHRPGTTPVPAPALRSTGWPDRAPAPASCRAR